MDLVTAALGSLIPKLLQLLEDEYRLQTGMKKKIQSLSAELESMHAFLHKVADVPWYQLDEQVKVWAREAREASYDMEDILDTFLVSIEGREFNDDRSRLKRAMKKMANLFHKGKARRDVGSAIKDIKSRLQEIADRRSRYKIDDMVVNRAATTSTIDPRLQAMYKEAASLVGIKKPRDHLISMLSSKADRKKKIVAIVGFGGLGKTTLAKAVYEKIKMNFMCGAFVPVGRNPNLSKVLMDILYELDKNRFADIHIKNRDERQLIDNLREFLIDKRYFIVIDDIWENKSWEETIKLALLENDSGSRIIITTRNLNVATEIGGVVYKMQPLSDNNSKKLFFTRIFGDERKHLDNLPSEITNKILKKCDGVPLAIITVASLLARKPMERWPDVFTSIGFVHEANEQVENTKKILSYSYYDMPSHLRACLLYLSVFPEDYVIDIQSLIWKWIAEGFIQGKKETRLFELGEEYFHDLVNRSMIQVVENEVDGMVEGCHVHDMVLDLICSISFEENFITILDSNNAGTMSPPSRTTHRLAIHDNTMEHTAQGNMKDMSQVRSCVAIRCAFVKWVQLSSFKLLRVLDMEDCKDVRPSHLIHLENLLHLRYLGLQKCSQVDELPNEIGSLKFLKIVKLENTKIRQLTPIISRLTQLVCLNGDAGDTLAPSWIGKLTSLEELQLAIDFSDGHEEHQVGGFFRALGSLRELRMFRSCIKKMNHDMERDLVFSLCNLGKLQHLEFFDGTKTFIDADTTLWGQDFVVPQHLRVLNLDMVRFSRFPPWISVLCNLTNLSLHVDPLKQIDLELMGRIPELRYLFVNTKSTVSISNNGASDGYFQKLKFYGTRSSMTLFGLKEGDSSVSFCLWNGTDAMPCFDSSKKDCGLASYVTIMPNLEVLQTRICVRALKDNKVEYGNIGLEYLPSLQKVILERIDEGASAAERNAAATALFKATKGHPNCPTHIRVTYSQDKWNSDVKDPRLEDEVDKEDQKQLETTVPADEVVTKSI